MKSRGGTKGGVWGGHKKRKEKREKGGENRGKQKRKGEKEKGGKWEKKGFSGVEESGPTLLIKSR